MPGALIHRLTRVPLTASAVVCGALDATTATWEVARVSCPACLRASSRAPPPPRGSRICTCSPAAAPCPACRTYTAMHRPDGSRLTVPAGPFRREKHFQDWLRAQALASGWLYYHPQRSMQSAPGFPDTVLVRGEHAVFAELKLPGKRLTPAQTTWITALGAVERCATYVWYPEDLETILELLQ